MESSVTWMKGMAFDAELEGCHFTLDADPSFGGQGMGPKPKGLTLTSLAGCTGMDVISMLQKMRVPVEGFSVEVKADLAENHPRVFTKIHILYRFKGKDLPLDKLEKAVTLSQEKYCGVSAMLKKAAEVTYEIKTGE
jgi:putative redox protein